MRLVRYVLRKSALFGALAEQRPRLHEPIAERDAGDGGRLALLRSDRDPRVRRWRKVGAQAKVFYSEQARGLLRDLVRGPVYLTRRRLEHPDLRELVDHGLVEVHLEPQHHAAEYRAVITRAGKAYVRTMEENAARRSREAQTTMFKGACVRFIIDLRKAQQLGLFGGPPRAHAAEPTTSLGVVEVRAHLAHDAHGVHLVKEHQRHVQLVAPPHVAAAVEIKGTAVEAVVPNTVDETKAGVRVRRGITYHELATSPHEWRPAEVTGFAETANKNGEIVGMPTFDLPSGYTPVKTRFSGGTGPDDMACELCGTPIKNVCYIVNDDKKLTMKVGNKCIESHAEAFMPGTATAATKLFAMRLKPEEIAPVNELMAQGVGVDEAAQRVRARLSAAARWDKANPRPSDEARAWWDRQRAQITNIIARRRAGEYLGRGAYDLAFGRGYERTHESVMVPKPPSMLAGEIRDRAKIPAPFLRQRQLASGEWAWPSGWTDAAKHTLEQLEEADHDWTKAEAAGISLHTVRDLFFPHYGVSDLRWPEARRMVPDWADHHQDLHETWAAKRQAAMDEAEGKARVKTHPTMVALAGLADKVREAEPWTDEEHAKVTRMVAELPFHKRPSSSTRSRMIDALVKHHATAVAAEPLRKGSQMGMPGMSPGARGLQLVASKANPRVKRWEKQEPAKPPSDHVRYRHPDTGEERTGQVVNGGPKGITVADHETGLTAKVPHGHYTTTDPPNADVEPAKPGAKKPATPEKPAGEDWRAKLPGLNKYPPPGVTPDVGGKGDDWKLRWRSPGTGKMVQAYETAYLRDNMRDKFRRINAIAGKLPELRGTLDTHLGLHPESAAAVKAAMVRLVDHTAMRAGNEDSATKGVHGVSTLLKRHVKVTGDTVHLDYVGKSSVPQQHEVTDPKLAALVRHQLSLPGDRLFQAQDGKGKLAPVTADQLNDYVRTHLGEDHTLKDLRTFHATRLFSEAADKLGPPGKDDAEEKIQQAAMEVAKHLGHKKAVKRGHFAVHDAGTSADHAAVEKHGGKLYMHGERRSVGFTSAADKKAYMKATGAGDLPKAEHPDVSSEWQHEPQTSLDNYIDPTVVEAYRRGLTLSGGMRKAAAGADPLTADERRFIDYLGRVKKLDPHNFRGGTP